MYPAPTATAQQITNEEKAVKVAKLHNLFNGCSELEGDELRVCFEALMGHLNVKFACLDTYVESRLKAIIENHAQELKAAQLEDFKSWATEQDEELSQMSRFVEMGDYFFDLINSEIYTLYSRFFKACDAYMIFPVSK